MGDGNCTESGLTDSGRTGEIAAVRRRRESITARASVLAVRGLSCERPIWVIPDIPIKLVKLKSGVDAPR